MKLSFFIASFGSRHQLIEPFIERYIAGALPYPLYIFSDGEKPRGLAANVHWIQDKWTFQDSDRLLAIGYRAALRLSCRLRRRSRPYSNNLLGYTPLWGHRLKSAIAQLRKLGYSHGIWSCDDGWFKAFETERLERILQLIDQYKPGTYRLTESLSRSNHQTPFRRLAADLLELKPDPSNLPCHYITHQTSLWDLKVLDQVTRWNDCACRHENSGAFRFHRGGWAAMEYEGDPVIPSLGVYGDDGFITQQGEQD